MTEYKKFSKDDPRPIDEQWAEFLQVTDTVVLGARTETPADDDNLDNLLREYCAQQKEAD
jgi:hypothetical protein